MSVRWERTVDAALASAELGLQPGLKPVLASAGGGACDLVHTVADATLSSSIAASKPTVAATVTVQGSEHKQQQGGASPRLEHQAAVHVDTTLREIPSRPTHQAAVDAILHEVGFATLTDLFDIARCRDLEGVRVQLPRVLDERMGTAP
jgi:hypothetical protein